MTMFIPRNWLDLLALLLLPLLLGSMAVLALDLQKKWSDSVIVPAATGKAEAGPQRVAPMVEQTSKAIAPLAAFHETVNRPLFEQSRRKPVPPEPARAAEPAPPPPAPPVAEPANVTLIGTLLEASAARALVRIAPSNEERWIKQGDMVEGWLVEEIVERRLILGEGERRYQLDLYRVEPAAQ